MNDQGVLDSAILLLSIGEEAAAEVLRCMQPSETQTLGRAMAGLKNVTREKMVQVLGRFADAATQQAPIAADSNEYVRAVLTRAIGQERATLLLDRIGQGGDAKGIEALKWMDAESVAEMIGHEHPQVIASILAHLERDHAGAVLAQLPERTRVEAVVRVATLDGIQPTALRELNEVLTQVLSSAAARGRRTALGGVRTAAEMLNRVGPAVETAIMDAVREHDTELAQKILDEMFVFEDLLNLDDRGVQQLLREVQSESLIVALKGASPDLREKVLKNMSQRAGEMLREDLEAKGPVRLSEVESEQREIMKIVRRLAEEGQIVLGGKGGDQYV
ncbi:MAG: flagellar motor switch protein FliG [Burkholderiales bacterium]|nr:flagellar motor switch protein FliG [Burkholderiales bacterium]